MRYLYLPIIILMMFMISCGNKSHRITVSKGKAVNEANANNKVVADSLREQSPGHASVLDAQSAKIDSVMEDAPEAMDANATFTIEQLKTQMQFVIENEKAKAAEWKKKFEEEKVGIWGSILQWSGWASVGGLGIWIMNALNVPGIGLIKDPLVRALAGKTLTNAEEQAHAWSEKAKIAHTTIASSVAGTTGLKYLDRKLKRNGIDIGDHITSLSNGKATDIEGLFKLLAQGHASDQGVHAEVKNVLSEVRDKNDTEGGELLSAVKVLNIDPPVKTAAVLNDGSK